MAKPHTPQKAEIEELVQLVISNVPKDLADEIDALAKKNDRSRTAEIRKLIAEAIEQRRAEEPAAAA